MKTKRWYLRLSDYAIINAPGVSGTTVGPFVTRAGAERVRSLLKAAYNNPKTKKKSETMNIVRAAPKKKKRATRTNPEVKGAYWLYLRTASGWMKLTERPTKELALRAAQQIANRTGLQVKITRTRKTSGK